MTIISCMVPEIWSATDTNFCHCGPSFALLPPYGRVFPTGGIEGGVPPLAKNLLISPPPGKIPHPPPPLSRLPPHKIFVPSPPKVYYPPTK